MTNEEIMEATKEYYVFGENEEDLLIRMNSARELKAFDYIVDFGTGEGRTAFAMALANPEAKVLTFDRGRNDISNSELKNRTILRADLLGINNLQMMIHDANDEPPIKEKIFILNIDIEDGYDQAQNIAENWFHLVKEGGNIFIQTFDMGKYPDMTKGFMDYIEGTHYKLGDIYGNTRVIHA